MRWRPLPVIGLRRLVAGLAIAALIVSIPHLVAAGVGHRSGQLDTAPSWLHGLYGGGSRTPDKSYFGFLCLAFVAYLVLLATATSLPARLPWGLIVGVTAAFTVAPPLLSHDAFGYIAYARLGAFHGLDPYTATAAAVPSDPVFAYVGWPHTASVYGPLFTLLTYPLGLLSVPLALWTLKGAAGFAVLAIVLLVARLASLRGLDPTRAAVFVGLNPLVYVHVVGGAHNDALMVLLLMLGVAAALSERSLAGGAAIVGAAAMKVSAALVAPFALLGAVNRPRLVVGGALAMLAIGGAAASVFGSNVLASIGLAAHDQTVASRYSVPATLSRLAGIDRGTVSVLAIAACGAGLACLLIWTAWGADWVRAAGWAMLGALLATAWLLPWYVIWVLPLAAISRDRKLTFATLALTAFQLVNRVPV